MPQPRQHIRLDIRDRVASLVIQFAGTPVNYWNLDRLRELEAVLDEVRLNPHLEVVLLRSGLPGGFCGGHDPHLPLAVQNETDATAYSVAGQKVVQTLAELDLVTLAFVEGPCLGTGLELALACDYRLAVAGPNSQFGWESSPLPLCWGGTSRAELLSRKASRALAEGKPLSAREAYQLGLVDDAFTARRAKVELRSWLDQLLARPNKRRRKTVSASQLAEERYRFRHQVRQVRLDSFQTAKPVQREVNSSRQLEPVRPLKPTSVTFAGRENWYARLVTKLALQGTTVYWSSIDEEGLERELFEAVSLGWATPLEADQARKRVLPLPAGPLNSRLVIGTTLGLDLAGLREAELRASAVLAVPSDELEDRAAEAVRPGRIVSLDRAQTGPYLLRATTTTRPDTIDSIAEWFEGWRIPLQIRKSVPLARAMGA